MLLLLGQSVPQLDETKLVSEGHLEQVRQVLVIRVEAAGPGTADELTYLAGDVDRYLQQLDGGGDKKDVERELSNMRNRLLDLKGLLR